MNSFLGCGLYTFPEAARLTDVRSRRLRCWFASNGHLGVPVHETDYADMESGRNLLSFLDLVDAMVMGRLREQGCSLQYLRKAHQVLAEEFRTGHPFSRQNLLTDGRNVFLDLADELGEARLREAITGQYAFPDVLKPYLERIEYDSSSLLARRWHQQRGIVIDPERQFGKPVVEASGIPTAVLAAAFFANGEQFDLVADWYGVAPEDVEEAVRFEDALRGRAA